jgi:hypothetical protein
MKYAFELLVILVMTFSFITLLDMVTSIPEVKYFESKVEYKNGSPQITISDVEEITDHGKKIPRAKWSKVLSSGRYHLKPIR